MVDLPRIVDDLSSVLDRPTAEKLAQVIVSVRDELQESLLLRRMETVENAVKQLTQEMLRSQEEFRELRREFHEYRKQTDERFRELAEAQQRMYAEFQEYRKQTDERFRELREAQQQMYAEFQEYRKQTDERFRQLAEAQQRMYAEFQEYRKQTDERFRELAEAQRRTEEQVALLAEVQRQMQLELRDMRRQLGGLSQTVGYTLENEAMKRLPELLQAIGIRVEGRLTRRYVQDSQGNLLEVNIFGTGYRDGEQVTLVGESKSQLSKNDVDRFLRRTVSALQGVFPNLVPLLVTHFISEPDAESYAREQGVLVYYSYEF